MFARILTLKRHCFIYDDFQEDNLNFVQIFNLTLLIFLKG